LYASIALLRGMTRTDDAASYEKPCLDFVKPGLATSTPSTSMASLDSLTDSPDSTPPLLRRRSSATQRTPLGGQSLRTQTFCGGCLQGILLFTQLQKKPRLRHALTNDGYELDRLEELGLIGSGAFGVVSLVKCSFSQETMALKSMSKGMIVQRGLVKPVRREKLAMDRLSSPFITRLFTTFNDEEHIHFLMDVSMGGDLMTVYRRYDFYGSHQHARFYIACMFQALEHMHKRIVLYRDLKMENVVVDGYGYAKLCDFGMARCLSQSSERAMTVCGTPEYMAPEVLAGHGYTFAVDWWGLGVLLFELLQGASPFSVPTTESPRKVDAAFDNTWASYVKTVQQKKSFGIDSVPMPGEEVWPGLVRDLCHKEPSARLPIREGGAQAFRDHAWFSEANFDWGAHKRLDMMPPHVPCVAGPEDISNFDGACNRPPHMSYEDPCTGWDDIF